LPPAADDEPLSYRIANNSEDYRQSRRRLLGGEGSECASGRHDDIDLERNQLRRENGKPLRLSLRPAIFNQDVAVLDVTKLTQSLTKRDYIHSRWAGVRQTKAEEADHWHRLLLRTRRERP
jgi:hypothetical protein